MDLLYVLPVGFDGYKWYESETLGDKADLVEIPQMNEWP